ncbi:MAG: hypothetical protein AB1Z20_18695 [Desulfobacterales bacterium]
MPSKITVSRDYYNRLKEAEKIAKATAEKEVEANKGYYKRLVDDDQKNLTMKGREANSKMAYSGGPRYDTPPADPAKDKFVKSQEIPTWAGQAFDARTSVWDKLGHGIKSLFKGSQKKGDKASTSLDSSFPANTKGVPASKSAGMGVAGETYKFDFDAMMRGDKGAETKLVKPTSPTV